MEKRGEEQVMKVGGCESPEDECSVDGGEGECKQRELRSFGLCSG